MTEDSKDFFEELCRENYGKILKYCYLKLKNEEDARDMVQEVFTIAWQKHSILVEHENALAFLYKTASNLCYAKMRQRKKETPDEFVEEKVESTKGDVLEYIFKSKDMQIDESQYYDLVVNCLSEENRALYDAYYVKHIPMKEIAKDYNMTQTSLRMRYVRIRNQIKKQIKEIRITNESNVTYFLGRHI